MNDSIVASSAQIALLEKSRQIIRDFHFALDMRHNAGAQAWECMRKLEALYEMPWEQNAELRSRGVGQHTEATKDRANAGEL